MKLYKLLVRAQMLGEIREPGFVFSLAEGEIGPHRTVCSSDHGANLVDHINTDQKLIDVPLYEAVVIEPEAVPEAE